MQELSQCLELQELAQKYKKTPAQIILRWGLQRQTIVIPKSTKPDRIEENIDIVGFSLTPEDMESIKKIDKNKRSNDPQGAWGIDIYA
jgi:diketogulonate reductase-like aldo/keto reductase